MTIEEIYTKCSEALSEYLKDNATKGDLPSDYVPLYKYLHSKNITIEDWNTLVKYVESTLSSDITFDKNIRTLYELLSTTLQTTASKEDVENVINDVNSNITALDSKKVDKVTSTSSNDRVYGITASGRQTTYSTSVSPNNNALARFGTNGVLQSNSPINNTDVTNKTYVDNLTSTKVDKGQPGSKWQLYGIGSKTTPLPNGNTISATEQALPNTVINRNTDGRAAIKDPINDLDIANKEYVDTTIKQKLASTYVYKGSVQTYAKLPTKANTGDVYNVIEAYQSYPAGTNFAWTGTRWDALGGSVDLSNYATKQEVANDLSKKLDIVSTAANSNRIYAIASDGSQYTPKLTNSVVSGEVTVPIRDANGNFKVGTPKVDGDASNKKYVDDSISTKADKKESHDFLYGGYVHLSHSGNPYSELSTSGKISVVSSDELYTSGDITLMYTVPKRPRHIKGSKKWYTGARTKYCNRVFEKDDGTPLTITPYRVDDDTFFNIGDVLAAIFNTDRGVVEENTAVYRKVSIDGIGWETGIIGNVVQGVHTIPPRYKHNETLAMEDIFKYNIPRAIPNLTEVKLYGIEVPKSTDGTEFEKVVPFKYMRRTDRYVLQKEWYYPHPICFQIKFIKNYQKSGQSWTGTMANLYLNVTMECQDETDSYKWTISVKPFTFKSNAKQIT